MENSITAPCSKREFWREGSMSKEVFLIVEPGYDDLTTEISVYDTLEKMNHQLAIQSFGNLDDEIEVYHGILVDAKFLPRKFNGCTPYLYVTNPLGARRSEVMLEAHWEKLKGDPEVVALAVEELLNEKTFEFDNGNVEVTIDDVQLFFGQQLQKVLSVPEDHLDEEMIERVELLGKELDIYKDKLKGRTHEA